MRKELIWAGAIGITFGLVIAFGAWRISSSNNNSTKTSATPTPSSIVSEFKIALDKPSDNDVITESAVNVSGITKALVWVTVSGESGDYIIQSDEQGAFSQDVDLVPGVNQIRVTALDKDGNQSVGKVLVVYSASFQPASPAATPTDTSSESAIRAKVQEKVLEALNKPKAYIGVVTDIADSTIQIKSTGSEIQQISVANDNITVVNIKGTNNKTIKLTDIAIGDFIVAMGYVNSKAVLSAQRILVTDPVEEPKIDTSYGKVSDDSGFNSVIVTDLKTGDTATISPGAKTVIQTFNSGKWAKSSFAKIVNGDMLIYVSDRSGTVPVIRSIFVVQKAQS